MSEKHFSIVREVARPSFCDSLFPIFPSTTGINTQME